MHSYFRLMPAPSLALHKARRRVQDAMRVLAYQKERVRARCRDKLLDANLLLSTINTFAPSATDVVEVALPDACLCGAVHNELLQFTHLRTIDVSGNTLQLADLSSLPALQSLDLTANNIHTL
uniref:Uncharacterized protein n=1 Tax=Lygus hesperus TaxID=30085 RepID=A0A146LZG0_LYGHE